MEYVKCLQSSRAFHKRLTNKYRVMKDTPDSPQTFPSICEIYLSSKITKNIYKKAHLIMHGYVYPYNTTIKYV